MKVSTVHRRLVADWGAKDVPMGGVVPPSISTFARKLVKSQPFCKRIGHSIFCDLSLVTIVGQLVKTPPPQQKVSRHITGGLSKIMGTTAPKPSGSTTPASAPEFC